MKKYYIILLSLVCLNCRNKPDVKVENKWVEEQLMPKFKYEKLGRIVEGMGITQSHTNFYRVTIDDSTKYILVIQGYDKGIIMVKE